MVISISVHWGERDVSYYLSTDNGSEYVLVETDVSQDMPPPMDMTIGIVNGTYASLRMHGAR